MTMSNMCTTTLLRTLTLLPFILSCFIPVTASAQNDAIDNYQPDAYAIHDRLNFYFNLQGGIPLGELKKATDRDLAIGFSTGCVLNPFGKKQSFPLFLGPEFGYLGYGSDKTPGTVTTPPLITSFNI